MKITKLLESGPADIPANLVTRYDNLVRLFKDLAPGLDPATVEEVRELLQNCDDDYQTGDAGFLEANLDEIESLLQ